MRDRDVYADIVARLRAIGVLAEVFEQALPEKVQASADLTPTAYVVALDWKESLVDMDVYERTVEYTLALCCRAEERADAFAALDLISAQAQDALSRQPLGGSCVGAKTWLKSGRWMQNPRPPEYRCTMTGQFTYLVNGGAAHDTTP